MPACCWRALTRWTCPPIGLAAAKEVKLFSPGALQPASYANDQSGTITARLIQYAESSACAANTRCAGGRRVEVPGRRHQRRATGAGQFTYTLPQFIEQFDPDWRVITAPGVFKDMAHFLRAMNTPAWKAKQESLAETKGFRILKWTNPIGHYWIWTKNARRTRWRP